MGTKRQLAETVSAVVARCKPGPFLDLFSGLCAVATTVGLSRQVWTNDFQYFAQSVSKAHFCSKTVPLGRLDSAALISRAYSEHAHAHLRIASNRILAEEAAISAMDTDALNAIYIGWRNSPRLENWQPKSKGDATLFRDTFAGAYFGLSQAIEIDAIRFAIDKAFAEQRIDEDQQLWMILALCVSLSKCSTSTGHFAQPLTAKTSNINRFINQRTRSIRDNWLMAIENLRPVGNAAWRQHNRSMRGDALSCLSKFSAENRVKPSVVYADPPYTNDQYSRYYHVYETLIRYDYPEAEGRGLYRKDREVSTFSLSTEVHKSIEKLIQKCFGLGADLVLSYPANGLFQNSRENIPKLMRDAYGLEPEILEINHEHSTMGGSKGASKKSVTEVIYRACYS